MIKAIESVYIAGKMEDDDWRQEFFDKVEGVEYCFHDGNDPLVIDTSEKWPKNSLLTVCGLRYTGPFFVDTIGGHGFQFWEEDAHGGNACLDHYKNGQAQREDLERKRKGVQQECFEAIKNADLLFAWINCIDCYGTIAEIGYAKALGKPIWIAGSRRYDDLWFAYAMADKINFASSGMDSSPHTIFRSMLTEHREDEKYRYSFDSPIEKAFWDAWCGPFRDQGGNAEWKIKLTPQYPIGKYRVDFAHVETKTAIELDGHATHSSPDAIAHDRKRQRYLESQGWHVIRFGGKEIYSNLSECLVETYRLLDKRIKEAKAR